MSTVKIEPFFFGSEEESIQMNTQELPGAVQKQENKEEKKSEVKPENTTESKEETQEEEVVVEEEKEEENDSPDSFGFFGKTEKSSKEDKKKEVEEEKLTADKVDYSGLTDFLIETGVFKDFEGKEAFEYNADTFKALWDAQAKNQVGELLNEERSQFGGAANQLIDYLKDGGTVEDFTANYSQQLDIASIDTSEEDGQERAVKEYYKSIDWSDAKIKKHLDRLKDDNELKEEAEDCKTKLVSEIESQREEMLKEQEAIAQDRKIRVETFNKQVREAIYKDADLADREKKELDKFVFDYKYQDKQGNKYSEFAVKMNEINQDSKKYAKFLKFVKNIEAFEDKKVAQKEADKKTFNFLKKGATLENAQTAEVVKQKTNSPPAFKFK